MAPPATAEIRVPEPAEAFNLRRWTTEQGLPTSTVKALLQTRDGYVWIGTLNGLARFDGVTFTVFDHANTPEMINDAINDLAEDDRDGSLWIAAGRGLLRYREHRFESYPTDQVGELRASPRGGVWFSGNPDRFGLARDGQVRFWNLPSLHPGGSSIVVEEVDPGEALILAGFGLHRCDLSTGALTRFEPPGPEFSCRAFAREADGTAWLGRHDGLWRFREARWVKVAATEPGREPSPDSIFPSPSGGPWVGVSGGTPARRTLHRVVDDQLVPFALEKMPPDLTVTHLLEDHEGGLWFGSKEGLLRLRRNHVRVFSTRDGLTSDNTQSVTCAPNGTVWVGTDAGFASIRGGQVSKLSLPRSEPGDLWTLTMLADRAGRFWFGGRGRLTSYRNGNWGQLTPPPEIARSFVHPSILFEDQSRRLWIGMHDGVACVADGTWKYFATTNDPAHTSVRAIHQDRRGDLWFGLYGGGLNRLRDERITAYRTSLGEYNNRAWWIHEDADGVFWVGSQNGLNRFVPPEVPSPQPSPVRRGSVDESGAGDRFFTFTTVHGLHENTINNIQEDDAGFLWLSGLRGIYRVARSELNDVAAGRRTEARVLALGEADGMLNSECNGGDNQPAGCKDREGRIWFPTAKGVVLIDPREIRRNDVAPPVVIERIIADETPVPGAPTSAVQPLPVASAAGSDASLEASNRRAPAYSFAPGRARVLEIRYTATSFVAPERVRFRYRLEGYDRDWRRDDANRRVAFYTNLRPGTYTFRVTACNNHGIWNDTGASFAFAIAPQFWETPTFQVLCVIGVVGLAAGVQAYRLRTQRRVLRFRHQEAFAGERIRIARDLHDDLGTALTGLALELDMVRREADGAPTLTQRLAHTAQNLRGLAERMREVVWAVNPRCDNLASLASFLEQQASQFLGAAGVQVRLEFPEAIPALPMDAETRHQLTLGVREAFTNVIRHAAATEVRLSLALEARTLVVRIQDNGHGFLPADPVELHHGLANLHERMKRVGGCFECASVHGAGTTVTFRVPFQTPPASTESNG